VRPNDSYHANKGMKRHFDVEAHIYAELKEMVSDVPIVLYDILAEPLPFDSADLVEKLNMVILTRV